MTLKRVEGCGLVRLCISEDPTDNYNRLVDVTGFDPLSAEIQKLLFVWIRLQLFSKG